MVPDDIVPVGVSVGVVPGAIVLSGDVADGVLVAALVDEPVVAGPGAVVVCAAAAVASRVPAAIIKIFM